MANKVLFGISNVHYAVMDDQGAWGTPVHVEGAENFAIQTGGGNNDTIYADNIAYWTRAGSGNKSGTLQMAKFPDSWFVDILGQTKDQTTGALLESPTDVAKNFAFMFEVSGDAGGMRVCWYKCSSTIPTYTAATNTDSITEANQSVDISATPTKVGDLTLTQAACESGSAGYDTWFDAGPLATQGA